MKELMRVGPAVRRLFEEAAGRVAPALSMRRALREHQRRYGRSKYMPHQGARECERRRMQRILGRI